ncbi:MAG TPA: putative quinol monooxygenase [Cyclobacteriaceae bacterium]|nr:putative quinol monooxygenase [Cyclobacteriaceae bacterium]
MNILYRKFATCVLIMLTTIATTSGQDQPTVVRVARLIIDPAKLEAYNAALKAEIETSIQVEPGVITLYAVAEKSNPSHITIFETYANQAAYLSHLETPHFKKYKETTKEMVKSLELVEVTPVALGAKKSRQ